MWGGSTRSTPGDGQRQLTLARPTRPGHEGMSGDGQAEDGSLVMVGGRDLEQREPEGLHSHFCPPETQSDHLPGGHLNTNEKRKL